MAGLLRGPRWLVAVLAVCALLGPSAAGKPAPAAPATANADADVDITDGPAAVAAAYRFRGGTLTALLPRAEDGAAAGLYQTTLAPGDPLLAALAALPAQLADPAPRPDAPVINVVVRGPTGAHQLVSVRPPTDGAVSQLLGELNKREAALRKRPLLALALEARPAAGAASSVTVRVTATGAPGAEARIAPESVLVQAAPEPKRVPGVTPLPPDWQMVSAPPTPGPPRAVKAGAHVDLKLPITLPEKAAAPLFVRAALDGMVAFHVPATVPFADGRMTITSKASRLSSR